MAAGTAAAHGHAHARRKQLGAHLEAAFGEIQRLSAQLRDGVERLERTVQRDFTPDGAAHWFRMYLRLVDLGVEIRRGEQRHRSARPIEYACMHTTGTKGARHTGLSIDDANALYQMLEATPGVRESQLEVYFMRMDALDRDGVGLLDMRLSASLAAFVRAPSAFYTRVEVTGSDPHQELVVHGARHAATPTKVTRVCFNVARCMCLPDAEPWADFTVTAGDPSSLTPDHGDGSTSSGAVASTIGSAYEDDAFGQNPIGAINVYNNTLDDPNADIGLAELKRQYGFDAPLAADGDDVELVGAGAGAVVGAGLGKRRRTDARPPQPPREIYRRKCQERGSQRKRKLEDLLIVRNGGLDLNLSEFGFHAPQDLQDLLDVVQEAQVPIRLLDVTNNFFDTRSFETFCELLRLPLLRAHVRTLKLRCMALPQRPDFAGLLRILTDTDAGALDELTNLDLSYNTFFEDAVLRLNDLLNGLSRLQTLSLESCFPKAPDPGVVEVAVVKDLVRTALVTCCDRLQSLNFGSNWMSFPLLNSLFSPESALLDLQIAQMTFFYFEGLDAPPISWKFGFQRQESITLSETRNSRSEYLPFFLDALTYCLQMRIAQLKCLDLWIVPPHQRKTDAMLPAMQLDERTNGLLQACAEYGALRSLRVRYDISPRNAQARVVVGQLLRDGLKQCESLELAMGIPLTLPELRGMLAGFSAPFMRTLKLSVVLLGGGSSADSAAGSAALHNGGTLDFASVFRGAFSALTELTLEFKVDLKASKSLLPDAVVQEMESAWRSLQTGSSTRKASLVKRKPRKERVPAADGSGGSGNGTGQARDMVTFAFLFTTSG